MLRKHYEYKYKGKNPKIANSAFIAPSAIVIGDVEIGEDTNIWFSSVVRGDVNFIRIGENCNIQDMSMLHVTTNREPLIISSNCTLGHRVTAHGCTLKDYSFAGIGATLLDGSELGEYSILAAGSLLTNGKVIPPESLAMGIPAKVIRRITSKERKMIEETVQGYKRLKDEYKKSLSGL